MAHIIIASDHAGLSLKQTLIAHIREAGHQCEDLGTDTSASCHYPKYAKLVCAQVLAKPESPDLLVIGVLICGTGIGMSIVANRHKGIRAALCSSEFQARASREHTDANVLCLGERVTGPAIALAMLDAFLTTPFEGGRHAQRLALIDLPENKGQ